MVEALITSDYLSGGILTTGVIQEFAALYVQVQASSIKTTSVLTGGGETPSSTPTEVVFVITGAVESIDTNAPYTAYSEALAFVTNEVPKLASFLQPLTTYIASQESNLAAGVAGSAALVKATLQIIAKGMQMDISQILALDDESDSVVTPTAAQLSRELLVIVDSNVTTQLDCANWTSTTSMCVFVSPRGGDTELVNYPGAAGGLLRCVNTSGGIATGDTVSTSIAGATVHMVTQGDAVLNCASVNASDLSVTSVGGKACVVCHGDVTDSAGQSTNVSITTLGVGEASLQLVNLFTPAYYDVDSQGSSTISVSAKGSGRASVTAGEVNGADVTIFTNSSDPLAGSADMTCTQTLRNSTVGMSAPNGIVSLITMASIALSTCTLTGDTVAVTVGAFASNSLVNSTLTATATNTSMPVTSTADIAVGAVFDSRITGSSVTLTAESGIAALVAGAIRAPDGLNPCTVLVEGEVASIAVENSSGVPGPIDDNVGLGTANITAKSNATDGGAIIKAGTIDLRNSSSAVLADAATASICTSMGGGTGSITPSPSTCDSGADTGNTPAA